jgi:hypothetical protein
MTEPFLDPNWTLLSDKPDMLKSRCVRGPGGMVIGRVLSSKKTMFDAEIFSRDQWLHVGEFHEFEQAVAAAAAPQHDSSCSAGKTDSPMTLISAAVATPVLAQQNIAPEERKVIEAAPSLADHSPRQ